MTRETSTEFHGSEPSVKASGQKSSTGSGAPCSVSPALAWPRTMSLDTPTTRVPAG
jgi:hypothetical protein